VPDPTENQRQAYDMNETMSLQPSQITDAIVKGNWHLDRRVTVSIILALCVQMVTGAYIGGTFITSLTDQLHALQSQITDVRSQELSTETQQSAITTTLGALTVNMAQLNDRVGFLIQQMGYQLPKKPPEGP
jgi:Tfp pilus assembly protein PilO